MTAAASNPKSKIHNPKSKDLLCVFLILAATIVVYAPSLFANYVLLPADIVPIMRPWAVQGRERFANHKNALNQMHGPIFEYYSWRYYARERIRQGEVPLWNPYELSGNVLLANSQSAVLYPPNALLYLFSLTTGINLVTALHTFLTGLFLYGLMRVRRLVPVAALTSAFVWMFCGVQMGWLEFQTPTAAMCWLPGLLLAWEIYAQRGAARVAILGGSAGVALTLLAGHLQFAFYVLTAFALYALFRSVAPELIRRSRAAAGRSFGLLCAALALGAGLSACTLLPVVEMGRLNFRAGQTEYGGSIALRMPAVNLLTLVQPNVFGSPRDYIIYDEQGHRFDGYPYWGAFDYIEYACYLGLPGLLLGIVGIGEAFSRRKPPAAPADATADHRSIARFFTALAATGLLLAMGSPLCAILFYGVPGYSQFNATGRALCLFCFGMAALAGIGLDAIVRDRYRVAGRFGLGLTGIIVAGLAAFPGLSLVYKKMVDDHWMAYEATNLRQFVVFVALTAACGWLIFRRQKEGVSPPAWPIGLFCALALGDLLTVYAGFNPQVDPAMLGYPTDVTTWLQRAFPSRIASLEAPGEAIKSSIVPNYNVVVGLREVQGADSLHTKRYHQLMERVVLDMYPQRGAAFPDPNTIHVPMVSHPVFDMLNVRYLTTLPGAPNFDPARLRKTATTELDIWENGRAMGPAWVVGRAEQAEGLDGFLNRLYTPGFSLATTALLEFAPPPLDPAAAGSPVRLTAFAPHHLSLEVNCRGRGLLVISEIAFPGWSAQVDGRTVPLLTADHILRSVPITPGPHHVQLDYRPSSYVVGVYLSSLSIGFFSALGLVLRTGCQRPRI